MSDSQKFISRNRAPRVQIEYDVELYGAEKKVQLPFVMGVISDLSGKAEKPDPESRDFLDIDVDNIDARMRAIAPRASFTVPNTLTGEGNLSVDLTFEKMEDFSPAAIASKVDVLRPLLEARTQLSNLMAYMDGKAGAEALIEKILGDAGLLKAVAGGAASDDADTAAALDALRASAPVETEDDADDSEATLAALRAAAPEDVDVVDEAAAALEGLRGVEVAAPAEDGSEDVLSELAAKADTIEVTAEDDSEDVLKGLAEAEVPDEPEVDASEDVLEALADAAPAEVEDVDASDDVLKGLADVEVTEEQSDGNDAVLSSLAEAAPEDVEVGDASADVLKGLADVEVAEEEADDNSEVLDALAEAAPDDEAEEDASDDILSELADTEIAEDVGDESGAVLDTLAEAAPESEDADDASEDILADLAEVEVAKEEEETSDDVLDALLEATPEEETTEDDADDILSDLADVEVDADGEDSGNDVLEALAEAVPDQPEEEDGADDILADLGVSADLSEDETDDLDAILGDIEAPAVADDGEDADDILSDLGEAGEVSDEIEETGDDVADVLAGLETRAESAEIDDSDDVLEGLSDAASEDDESDDLDDILGDLGAGETDDTETDGSGDDDLDALLADMDDAEEDAQAPEDNEADADLDALLADMDETEEGAIGGGATEEDGSDDLDALLSGVDDDDAEPDATADDDDDDLDSLLADLDEDDGADGAEDDASADDDMDALLADLDEGDEAGADDDLDALLADDGDAGNAAAAAEDQPDEGPDVNSPFGYISATRPEKEALNRKRFRMAIFGDFTGRAARGLVEVGDALATRREIRLDVDTVEDVIERFATTLVLPIGKDGDGIEVKLNELDDLHPDELYDNVEMFQSLSGLRQRLGMGSMAEKAVEELKSWGENYGKPVKPPKRSASTSVPADRSLSDFQNLIGDSTGRLATATPADDLIARVVGPHVVAAPDPGAAAMQAAVDEALSSAMQLILHHPDFQAIESQWRSLDFLARRVETGDELEIVLFDVSAEELGIDLAAQDDLAESGLFRLLAETALDAEEGKGGFSAMFGLYTFEETPPHAELLARIARVAAHVDAPFFTAISPAFLETKKIDRHRLVAEAWDTLRGMAEAKYLGVASPRFMLRHPYGAKSDPIDAFDFEEFTMHSGLSGMLWANPVVLVAVLLAGTFKQQGASDMSLGTVMSLGEIPFHYILDSYGDQVALPCTERNITTSKMEIAVMRGIMPVLSTKGRDEIRLGSFQAMGGGDILGRWSENPSPAPPSPKDPKPADVEMEITGDDDDDLDIGDLDMDDDLDLDGLGLDDDDDDGDLDDLLAGFGDDDDNSDDGDDSDIDDDLAALLDDL